MSLFRASHLQYHFTPRLSPLSERRVFHAFGPTLFLPEKHAALTPNRPVDIDPALQALLSDADISLSRANAKSRLLRKTRDSSRSDDIFTPTPHRELEVLETIADAGGVVEDPETHDLDGPFPRSERKSPAASFGSRGLGAVVLPFELQRSVLRLISGV